MEIRHGKWLAASHCIFRNEFWEFWIGSDMIRISQIRHGKWLADSKIPVTDWQDQGFPNSSGK